MTSRERDELGRGPFIDSLYTTVRGAKTHESMVVGLYGAWGQGKSSILNLLEERVRDGSRAGRLVLVRFNPWLYSDPQTLLLSLFGTLRAALGRAPLLSTGQRRTVASAVKAIGKFVGTAATATGAEADARIIVLIDDLDRADDDEVRALLKAVRLLADLPRISYVIAMDHLRVRQVLAKQVGGDYGSAYLEKIVQVPVHVPSVGPDLLERLTRTAVLAMLTRVGMRVEDLFAARLNPDAIDYAALVAPRVRTLRDRARLPHLRAEVLRLSSGEQRPGSSEQG